MSRPDGLDDLTADNAAHWGRLAGQVAVGAGPFDVMRLTVLVEVLLGERAADAEMEFQIRLSRRLDEIDGEIEKARQRSAVVLPPGVSWGEQPS